ncbi:hypothetical protein BD413DRAFT_677923, partial [Trametes elegans]
MLYQLLRAVLASLLPLLPLLLRPEKVDDWTRMLTSGLTPQFLPHSYSNNIFSETYELAHDFDESLTIDSFGHAIAHYGSAHPLLEAFVAVARQLFPGLVTPSLRKLVPQLLAVCFPLMTWVVYLFVASRTGLPRSNTCGAHPGDLDRCDLVINGSDVDSARDCTSSSATLELGEHEATQRADTALDLSPKSRDDLCTSPVAELLLSWEEDTAVPAPVIELDDTQRLRSLSDITERSEPEDYDAKGGDTPRCHQYAHSLGSIMDLVLQGPSTVSTPKMLQVQEDLPMHRDLRCAFDTLSVRNLAGDNKSPSPKPDLVVGPAHTSPQLPETSSDPFISTPMELALPVQFTHSDSLRGPGEPPVSRSRRTSAILVARAGMRGQQVNLTSAGIEYAASQLQGKSDTVTVSSAKDERRRLERVATDAAAVFSEYRGTPRPLKDILRERAEAAEPPSDEIQRNILDVSQYPPLAQDAQIRRPIVELSRSRGGNGINPTSLVFLERNHASALRSNDISSAASVPHESLSLTEQSFPKLEPSQPRLASLAVMIRPVKTDGAAPLSYAAMTAQPAPSPRPRYVSEQLRVAVANGLKRRAASAGVPPSQRVETPMRCSAVPAWRLSAHAPSFVPRTAARAPPLPTRGADAARSDEVPQERPPSASVRGNWRVRRLPSDRELNAEFAASPAHVPQIPPRQAGSAVRGSLLS